MITHRMLGLLHSRLVANAPRQAGSDEYRMGIDDAIAAVRRLIEAGSAGDLTDTWRTEELDGGPVGQGEPNQTQLAAEYLQLEMTSLVRTIDSMLRQPTARRPPGDAADSSLLDAKAHLIQARRALRQTQGSVSS